MADYPESSYEQHKRLRNHASDDIYMDGWTDDEKHQLVDAMDMYGTTNVTILKSRMPYKTVAQVSLMLFELQNDRIRKIGEYIKESTFVRPDDMSDLFRIFGVQPLEVMKKWIEYLDLFYKRERHRLNLLKTFATAFLMMSQFDNTSPMFKNVYYFLYRVFNNYNATRRCYSHMSSYLLRLYRNVLDSIRQISDKDKTDMYNVVYAWADENNIDEQPVEPYFSWSRMRLFNV